MNEVMEFELDVRTDALRVARRATSGAGQPPGAQAQDRVWLKQEAQAPERATYSKRQLQQQFTRMASPALLSPSIRDKVPRLDQDDHREVQRLVERDRYVHIHEMRHAATLGIYAGPVHYNYEIGPDGRAYAVGGYTVVNALPATSDEAMIAKARTIRAAATAPGELSGTDMAVAVQAAQMERMATARMTVEG